MVIRSNSPNETARLAERIAKNVRVKRRRTKGALVIALSGDLGTGKTEFVRSFIREMGVRARITSPTFLLSRRYPIRNGAGSVFHLDAYRITNHREMELTDIREAVRNQENVVLVEWGEKIKPLLPKDTVWIRFRHGAGHSERAISFDKSLITL